MRRWAVIAAVVLVGCRQLGPSSGPTGQVPPSASPSPSPSPSPSSAGLTRDQAIALARSVADPNYAADEVLQAEVMPFGQLDLYAGPDTTPRPGPDRLVWFISLGHISGPQMGAGVNVVIDVLDGTVIANYGWIT
jgi:hypothetical protein